MNFNDFSLIPKADYKDACDAIREKTDKTDAIASGEMGDMIRGITSGGMAASIFVIGLSESDTVTATKDGKSINGVWVERKNPAIVLPEGYTQLEYIESSGTQYIDTGVKGKHGIKTILDFTILSGSLSDTTILGCATATYSSRIYAVSTQNSAFAYGFGDWYISSTAAQTGKRYFVETDFAVGAQSMKVDGVTVKTSTSTTSVNLGFNLSLFGNNAGGTVKVSNPTRVYACKIYNDNSLVRDYVPAKRNSDGAYGLYDLVDGVFYTNKGTGTFIAGAEVEIPSLVYGHEISKIVDRGMWTVTATNGIKTKTQNVLVDGAFDYEIEMSLGLWLYREGDECEDVTGGWLFDTSNVPTHGTTASEKREDSLYVQFTSSGTATSVRLYTKNLFDLTDYKKIYFDVAMKRTDPYERECIMLWDTSGNDSNKVHVYNLGANADIPRTTIEYDISSLSKSLRPWIAAYTYHGFSCEVTLHNCWLE